jgi:hypothetical protein
MTYARAGNEKNAGTRDLVLLRNLKLIIGGEGVSLPRQWNVTRIKKSAQISTEPLYGTPGHRGVALKWRH